MSLTGSFVSSTMVSVLAVGRLDYFFTTPLFTLGMSDLQSYVAMIVFLTISLIITRLVSRVRKRTKEALSSVSYKVIKGEETGASPDRSRPSRRNWSTTDFVGVRD
jgi:K+-sensing histidine kinase KdpD